MGERKVAWMSTKFPLELPAAFGMEVVCPESAGAAAALKGQSGALCEAAGRMGWCDDLCSYTRMGLALAAEGGGGLPRPDVLLCCDNICSNMLQWYQEMARLLSVPLLTLDIPYQDGLTVSDATVAYIRGQLEDIILALEQLTGKPWQEDIFAAVCRRANDTTLAWQEVMDTALLERPVLGNLELFDYMPLLVTGRCREETAPKLRRLAGELRARPPRSGPRPRRVFFEGTPCWPSLSTLVEELDRLGLLVVADTLSPSLGFRYTDLPGLIRAYCGTVNGSSLEAGIRERVRLCRRYGVEGVLVHYNRSCRPWCGTLAEVERRLSEELGVPVVSFGGDQGDPRAFSPAQFTTRLEGLAEIMEAREDAR